MLDMPTLLDIGIMGHCKNKCAICYQGSKSQPNMTLNNFKKIIDEVEGSVNQVALGGRGDPNHHENFEHIIEYCREHNVIPNYTTSGRGLTNRQAEVSRLCGAVAVSDYQQPYTYRAINRFKKVGVRKVNIHYVFTRGSYGDVIKLAYGHNPWRNVNGVNRPPFDIEAINGIIFLLFKPQGRAKNFTQFIPEKKQVKHFAEVVSEKYPRPFKIGMDSCLVNLITHDITEAQQLTTDTCEGGRMSAYISPDMRLMPCSFAHKAVGESIQEKSIQEVWTEAQDFKIFRKILFRKRNCCPLGL
jgi:hypothetical protein